MKTASALAALILVFSFLIAGTASVGVYDPWADLDNDGDIDIYDIVYIAGIYGSEGENITKTSVEFDSGWINITDEAGQYFYITHNLNTIDWDSPNTIADITGKTTIGGGLLRLGLANYARHQTYGGAYIDTAYSMVQTTDGGYALAGATSSFGAGAGDFWLVKTDASGTMQWNQTYGGAFSDLAYSMVQTTDGGYALAGATSSFGAGNEDFWLVKTDASGTMQWNQTYGGAYLDIPVSMVQTTDGGYALAGLTMSFGAGSFDVWLVEADFSVDGLTWTDSTDDAILLYRSEADVHWNYIRVRILKVREYPEDYP